MSKSRRLLELAKVVRSKEKFTVRELADEFGVSYRTMHRDLQDLGELGVPLYSEYGSAGGYRVLHEKGVSPIHWGEASTKRLDALGLKGRTSAEPTVVVRGEFKVIGIGFTGPFDLLPIEMPNVWQRFLDRAHEVPNVVHRDVWIDIAQENHLTNTFTQYVSVEVRNFEAIPHGMVGLTILAQKYAVFTHTGPMDQVMDTYYSAFKWLDEHGYTRTNGLRFELYDHRYIPPVHPRDRAENAYDIYLPIR